MASDAETSKLISAEKWVDAFLDHHSKAAPVTTKVDGPFARYRCAECGQDIYMQISAKFAIKQLQSLRSAEPLYCAPCWQPGQETAENV